MRYLRIGMWTCSLRWSPPRAYPVRRRPAVPRLTPTTGATSGDRPVALRHHAVDPEARVQVDRVEQISALDHRRRERRVRELHALGRARGEGVDLASLAVEV